MSDMNLNNEQVGEVHANGDANAQEIVGDNVDGNNNIVNEGQQNNAVVQVAVQDVNDNVNNEMQLQQQQQELQQQVGQKIEQHQQHQQNEQQQQIEQNQQKKHQQHQQKPQENDNNHNNHNDNDKIIQEQQQNNNPPSQQQQAQIQVQVQHQQQQQQQAHHHNDQKQQQQVHHQQQHPQEQQQGQLPESHPHIENQLQHQNNTQKQQQNNKNKDSYINKLQLYVNKLKAELNNNSQKYQQLQQDNKKTKQTLKKIRFQFLSTKQQLSTTNQQKLQIQKHHQTLTQTNTLLNQQLKTFRQAGDINYYKNKIIDLEKLLSIQKKQLLIKTTMIDQKDQLQSSVLSNDKNKIEILKQLEKYQKQNVQMTQKYAQITQINSQLQSKIKTNELTITELKKTVDQTVSNLNIEKQKAHQLEEQLKNKQQEFQKTQKLLEQNLQQLLNDKQIQKINPETLTFSSKKVIKSPQELYGIKILTPLQERNLIMKEYIDLEIRHQSLTEEINNLRERHYNTLRQNKNISATYVPKKDFSELFKKYAKLRKCLESSLINEENLRKELQKYLNKNGEEISQENDMSKGQAESQAFSKYKSLVLSQPQNEVNKVDKIIQKSTESQKQLYTLKQQLQTKQKLIRTQKLIKQKDQKIMILEKDNQKCKNLIKLYDTEITYKNCEIQLLRKSLQQAFDKVFNLQKNFISKAQQQQLNALIEQNKMVNQILEIKNIQALKQNAILKSQKQNLTQIYNDLKIMYEELINREPELKQHENKQQKEHKQGSAMDIQHNKPCKQCLQREQKLKSISFSQVQTQTQGLSEIYFKQIKELLTVLRKFPKRVDNITGVLEAEKLTIHEVKKRYDQVMQAYGVKYRQLEEEKKANDQWRLKQKDEIREEFQQVREMLLNERLVTALRKAKQLIEYYENNAPEGQGEENLQEGEQQEGNEKPNPNAEQPIEQEKQNA